MYFEKKTYTNDMEILTTPANLVTFSGTVVKQTAGSSAVCYVMHSNGLSLGASNFVGTQNINGGAAANIRFCSIRVNSY